MSEQIERLRKASMAVYLATEKDVADDLSNMLRAAADHIAELEAENDHYRNGYKGGCWTCESVGELNVKLEADRNAWRECAERLGRQVASLTHNLPTDIPLLGGNN